MGYEVLGVGDTDTRAGAATGPDRTPHDATLHEVTVVTLEPDETWLREDRPRRERRPWTAERWATRPAWLGGTGPGLHLRTNRALAGAVTAALLVGIVCGALFTRHHERAVQAESLRGLAIVTSDLVNLSDNGNGLSTVTLTVRLRNLGPLPLSLAPADPSDEQPRDRTTVRPAAGAASVVPPRGTLLADVTTPIDCAATSPAWPSVRLRSQDGAVHQVTIPVDNMSIGTPQTYCEQRSFGADMQVMTALVGTLAKPVIRVTNGSHRSLKLVPAVDSGPDDTLVHRSFLPRGAQTVAPGRSADFAVLIHVARCEKDLGRRTDAMSQSSWTEIQVADAIEQNAVQGVDLSGAVGAALERACH